MDDDLVVMGYFKGEPVVAMVNPSFGKPGHHYVHAVLGDKGFACCTPLTAKIRLRIVKSHGVVEAPRIVKLAEYEKLRAEYDRVVKVFGELP